MDWRKDFKENSIIYYSKAILIDAKEIGFEESNAIPVGYVINKDGKLNHKNNR